MSTGIKLVISGGELFQRNAIIREIAALLQSVDVGAKLPAMLPVLEDEEHADHVRHVATHCTITIEHKP